MNFTKKILAAVLSLILVVLCFSGCSKSTAADEITSKTLLIAYTEDKAPFIYEEDGVLKGFDVEIFDKIFESIKNDFKNYKFVKVDEDYRLGEDAYCVDADGKECIAYIMAGGVQKNVGDVNETYTFSDDIITNFVVTITKQDSSITDYTSLSGNEIGVVGDVAKAALDKHAVIKLGAKSVTEYENSELENALADLDSGKIKAVVVDSFTQGAAKLNCNERGYNVLSGELETVNYVYAFKKYDWYVESINNALYELQSPDYNDADELTPIVEKYFGYDASYFDYEPSNDK